jgi:hypothetical protein
MRSIADQSQKPSQFLLVLACLFTIFFAGWGTTRWILSIQFDRGCEGYLKRAADANTVELAKDNLRIAIDYTERHNLTSGYTSIVYNTPDEDVAYWHQNLIASLRELESVRPAATLLERSNLLIKLRETLLDNARNGVTVTYPDGISVYSHNRLFSSWAILSGLLAFLCLLPSIKMLLDD